MDLLADLVNLFFDIGRKKFFAFASSTYIDLTLRGMAVFMAALAVGFGGEYRHQLDHIPRQLVFCAVNGWVFKDF